MIDLDALEAAARAATPGPWELNRHGAVLGGPVQHYVNGSGRNQIALATGADWMRQGEQLANATHIVAANPAVVQELVARLRDQAKDIAHYDAQLTKLRAENAELRRRPSEEVMMAKARMLMGEVAGERGGDDEQEGILDGTARGIGMLHAELLKSMREADEDPDPNDELDDVLPLARKPLPLNLPESLELGEPPTPQHTGEKP